MIYAWRLLARQRVHLFSSSLLTAPFPLQPAARIHPTSRDAAALQHQARAILFFSKVYSKARGDRFNPGLGQPEMWVCPRPAQFQRAISIRLSELAVLTDVLWLQRSYNWNFIFIIRLTILFFPYGILEGDVSYFSLNILMRGSECVYNQFRNDTADGYLGCSSASGLLPPPRSSSSVSTGGTEAAGWKEGLLAAAVLEAS